MSTSISSQESPMRSRLGWMLRPYAGRLTLAVVLLIGLTGVNIVVPQLIGLVFNQLLDAASWSVIWAILSALLALFILRNLLYFYSKVSAVRVGEDLAFELRNRLFERLQQMNLQYYRTNKPGNLSSRVMNDSFSIQTFIQDELPKLSIAALMFVGVIAAMYATNWQLALATTIWLPLHLVVFNYFKGPIKSASRSAQEHMAEATGNLIEKFLGMEVVKGFTAERRESRAFENAIDASRQSQLRSKRYHVAQKVAADLLIGMGVIGLIGFGAYQVMSGRMEAGYLITFFLYVKEVNPTVLEMMSGFAKLTKTSASVDRINDVLEAPGAESETGGERPEIHGRVVFERVSFSYPDSGPVLRDISFEVEPGEVCAIVGHSGAGKSTLVNLVPRFHDPDVGRVFVDGHDARDIDRHHLRRSVSIAFQECFLFNSTILENLRYARPNASRAQIEEVCKRIGADDFIVRLPHGYDTTVGENGVTLSRGQKQLINLARAMLKNPKVLILDEATASIDEAREKQAMHAILQFMKGKTTFMITHRPEMLEHAHKVLQLVDGEVAYFGPPQEAQLMVPSAQPEPDVSFEADHAYRPDRPDEPVAEDDRPDARPSGSGIWRGIKLVALAAVIGLGAAGMPESVALAQDENDNGAEAAQNDDGDESSEDAAVAAETAADAAAEAASAAERAESAAERAAAAEETVEEAAAVEAAAEAQAAAEAAAEAAATAEEVAERLTGAEETAEDSASAARSAAEDAAARAEDARAAAEAAASSRDELVEAIDQARAEEPDALADALDDVETQGRGEGEFMAMPGLRSTEASELIDVIASRLGASIGYRRVDTGLAEHMPEAPAELEQIAVLSYEDDDGRLHMLQLGYRSFTTQPVHLWIYGQTVADGEAQPNDDLEAVREMIDQGQTARDQRAETLTVGDLATQIVPLSYAEPDRALGVLKSLGYETIEYTEGGQGPGGYRMIEPSQQVDPQNLPIVMALPSSDATDMVGDGNLDNPSFPHTSASPLMELMILYDPGQPGQLADVRARINETIDKPARQVLIEAMVLEMSEEAIEELGIQWGYPAAVDGEFTTRPWTNIQEMVLGQSGIERTPMANISVGRVFGHFDLDLEALVRTTDAEILSRPSILTLDNRQASINVGERIPIATTIQHATVDRLQFDFEYIDVGIFLNLRPRVSAEGEEVSMQITGEVSAEVPGGELEITGRDDDGDDIVLARAPRISERRVQTYSRIANNTPFIIGGLISQDVTEQIQKVPLLGDIPVIKHLFRRTETSDLKREVIIVITPYVLPENQVVGRHIPKDDDAFDSFDHELFRDAYRIRDEDVFDLTFLTENPQLRRMQQLADRIAERDHTLAERYPIDRFVRGRIPGERALVYRQMYEVVNRIGIHDDVGLDRVIYFEPQPDLEEGFTVGFLGSTLESLAKEAWTEAFPQRDPRYMPDSTQALQDAGKGIAMTYALQEEAAHILEQPVVDLRLIDVPDRRAWSRELWRLNQPDDEGRQRHTLIIHNERDLHRLRSALVLEKVVELNASDEDLSLRNFSIGRQLLMPAVTDDQMFVIDSEVAMYFFMTEQYYPALQQEMQRDARAFQESVREPEFRRHLGAPVGGEENPTVPQLE